MEIAGLLGSLSGLALKTLILYKLSQFVLKKINVTGKLNLVLSAVIASSVDAGLLIILNDFNYALRTLLFDIPFFLLWTAIDLFFPNFYKKERSFLTKIAETEENKKEDI